MCSRENGMDPEVANQVAPEEPPGSMSQLEWEEAVRAKDEHIDLLKASLTKLNQGLLEKDDRIAELEAHCQALTNQLAVAMETRDAGDSNGTAATEWRNGKEGSENGEQQATVNTAAGTQTAVAIADDAVQPLNGSSRESASEPTSNGCHKNGVPRTSNGNVHASTESTNTEAATTQVQVRRRRRGYQMWPEQGSPRILSTIHERQDATCRCSCAQRVEELLERLEGLEDDLMEKDDVIASLRADNKRKGSAILEDQQQKLQRAISEKDSVIAVLELQPDSERQVEQLRLERARLMRDLNDKAEQRLKLLRRDSVVSLEQKMGSLALQYQNCDREQVCEVLRILALDSARMKAYIDELLALVLERNSALLEGLPRIQLRGTRPELLTAASLPELLEELRESEANDRCLQEYADLLLKRIKESEPDILDQFQ